MQEKSPRRNHGPSKGPQAGAVFDKRASSKERIPSGAVLELQPMRRAHDGEVCEGLYSMGEIPHWFRGTVRGGAVKTDHSPHSTSTLHSLEQERKEAEVLGKCV